MLPKPLIGIYQEYKKDIDAVAGWLASTAKACGYSADLLHGEPTNSKTPGRLKGKARKEAKKQAQGPSSTQSPSSKQVIAYKDFVPLAEFICASQRPIVNVPGSFFHALNRVRDVKMVFRSEMVEHGMDPSPLPKEDYQATLDILENVWKVLLHRMPQSDPQFMKVMGGRIHKLSVYENLAETTNAAKNERPDKAHGDEVVYEAEAATSIEDALLVFNMVFLDMNKIRSQIKWIWSHFREGKMDLAAASVATDSAIDIVRLMIDELSPIFSPNGGARHVAEKFFFMQAFKNGHQVLEIQKWGRGYPKCKFYDVGDNCFYFVTFMLKELLTNLDPSDVPLYSAGAFGTYKADSDRKLKSGHEKYVEDKVVLTEYFADAATLARFVKGYPVEDGFVRGIKVMDHIKEVPFQLVFAAQVLLDVHHTIRDYARKGFTSLMREVKAIRQALEEHRDLHKNMKMESWSPTHESAIEYSLTALRWIREDPVFETKRKAARKRRMLLDESAEVHRVLQYSPILAGLALFHFRGHLYDFGISASNAWRTISTCTHMYNALATEDMLNRPWKDMHVVSAIQGLDKLGLGGERPSNPKAYAKKYAQLIGVTTSALTKRNERLKQLRGARRGDQICRAGSRTVEYGIDVYTMFKNRYVFHRGKEMDWTPKVFDLIQKHSDYDESLSDPSIVLKRLRSDEYRWARSEPDESDYTPSPHLSPSDMVRSLALALTRETMELTFPYLILHRFCLQLLLDLQKRCNGTLTKLYPSAQHHQNEAPYVVGFILQSFAENLSPTHRKLMTEAAEEVNCMLRSGAGVFCLRWLTRSTGYKSKEEKDET